jgi:4-hydroxy-tetrahydrodipicolinate synthase
MFNGAYTALVTPFKNGQVDYSALEALIESQITRGIDGLVPCGTTGESPTLTEKEHDDVISFTVKAVKKRVTVIAGTGSNSTDEAIRYTRHAKEVGADAALLAAPYYNKPSQKGLIAHYSAVAQAVPMPLILYNVPGRTGVNLNVETVAELSKNPHIVGVKEASGNLEQMIRIRALCETDFALISGDDTLTLPILAIGGSAVISVTSHLLPGETSRLVHSYLDGKAEESKELFFKSFDLVKTIMSAEVNPVGIKTALALRGEIVEEYRLPLVPASAESKEAIRQALEKSGLLTTAGRR